MENLLDLLEEDLGVKADTLNLEESASNVTLLDNQEKESEVNLRTPDIILKDYTNLSLDNEKIDIEIEEFKAKYIAIFEELQAIIDKKNLNIEKQTALKEELTESLQNTGTKHIANDVFKATFVAATTKSTFDRKGFETKYPVLCKQFLKYSDVKAYVKISEVKK